MASPTERAAKEMATELSSEGVGIGIETIIMLLVTVLPQILQFCSRSPTPEQIKVAAEKAYDPRRQRYRGGYVHRAERKVKATAREQGTKLNDEQVRQIVYKTFNKARFGNARLLNGCCAELS